MLVLSRRTGEEIQIGSCVSLRVIEISRSRVKLGISRPRDPGGACRAFRRDTGERPAADGRSIAARGRRSLTLRAEERRIRGRIVGGGKCDDQHDV